jgi:hypothetical protein
MAKETYNYEKILDDDLCSNFSSYQVSRFVRHTVKFRLQLVTRLVRWPFKNLGSGLDDIIING